MARERQVTRTVNVTDCEVMCLTISTSTPSTEHFTVTGVFENNQSALKTLKKLHETDDFKLVTVLGMTTEEVLYGMPEEKFIEVAEKLPPRKVYGEAAE